MKKYKWTSAALAAALLLSVFPVCPCVSAAEKIEIHVSPKGNDSADGSAEHPLATMGGAARFVKNMEKKGAAVDVLFHAGVYPMMDNITFSEADSGTADAPITYKNAGDGEVIFSGAKRLDVSKFEYVTDENILARLPQEAAPYVVQMDLKSQGVTAGDVTMYTRGAAQLERRSLRLNGKHQQLAQYPNQDYLLMGDSAEIITAGSSSVSPVFRYDDPRVSRWAKGRPFWIEGFFNLEYWGDAAENCVANAADNTITMNKSPKGIGASTRWRAINLLEEIDMPGEWYIDDQTMTLYYYPPYLLDKEKDTLAFSASMATLHISGASHLRFEGLTFSDFYRSRTIEGANSPVDDIAIVDCVFDTVGQAIRMKGSNILIDGCEFINNVSAGSAIYASNPDVFPKLTSSNIVVRNNHIYNYLYTHNSIDVSGVGTIVENNMIHRVDGVSINMTPVDDRGAECVTRYNECYNSLHEKGDQGVIYMGRSWHSPGNVVQHNFVHDFGADSRAMHLQNNNFGIYLDDTFSGVQVLGNIVVPGDKFHLVSGYLGGGGSDNVGDGNIVALSDKSGAYVNASRAGKNAYSYAAYTWLAKQTDTDFFGTTWGSKYPWIARNLNELKANGGVHTAKYNTYTNNVFAKASLVKSLIASEEMLANGSTLENNLEFDDLDIFVDPENLDYRIKNEVKEQYNLGDNIPSEDFDLSKIGPQKEFNMEGEEFFQTYPQNGRKNLNAKAIELSWEEAYPADWYEYTVATDAELQNVVASGTSYATAVVLPELENGRQYYWKVTAVNNSLHHHKKWDSVGAVYTFTTSAEDYSDRHLIDWSRLEKAIERAQRVYETVSGNKDYSEEAVEKLKTDIGEAETVLKNKKEVSSYAEYMKLVNNLTNRTQYVLESKAITYTKVDVNSTWTTTRATLASTYQNDELSIVYSGGSDGVLTDGVKRTNSEMFCFDMKADLGENVGSSWVAIGLSASAEMGKIYGGASPMYRVIIKHEQIELQSQGKASELFVSVPNDGFVVPGQWHSVQFGAFPVEQGVIISFIVDGKPVFEYCDTANALKFQPYLVMTPSGNGKYFTFRTSSEVPTGTYTLPEIEIKNGMEGVYTINDSQYQTGGSWTTAHDIKGYDNISAARSGTAGSSAGWLLTGDVPIGYYKLSYWHSAVADGGDSKATLSAVNHDTNFKTTIDFTQGEDGWREIGIFKCINPSAKSELEVMFTPSGGGLVPLTAIKTEQVTAEESYFSAIFTQKSSNSLLLKVGNTRAFKNIAPMAEMDVAPVIVDERTLVPIRFAAEAFGADVNWDEGSQTVTITSGEKTVTFVIGSVEYRNGDETTALDVAPAILDGRTMIPLRAMAESLGKKLYWNGEYGLILVADDLTITDQDTNELTAANRAFGGAENEN